MGKRNRKNKILKFHPNGMKTKDRTYNHIKKLLDKKTTRTRDVLDQQEYLENTFKEYLENKKYNVYLARINFPLSVTIMTSPKLLEPDLKNLKHDFGLTDYELEIELSDNLGQYYFR